MDPGGIVVRAAAEADHDDIWALTQAFAPSFVPTRAAFDRSLARVLADVDALLLVAQDQTGVVGYLLAHRHQTLFADGPVAWVEELMVHDRAGRGRTPAHAAGRGVGPRRRREISRPDHPQGG